MELKDKKINFLGDSITFGHGVTEQTRFTTLIENQTGAICRNYGISGTRIAKQSDEDNDQNFCDRVAIMDADADIIVVFGGTNDFGHGNAPFGCPDDREYTTFWGGLHTLFSSLIEKYPDADIVVITPLKRHNEDSVKGDCKPEPVGDLKKYVNAICEAAGYYSLPVLDLFSGGKLQTKIPVIQNKFMPDGLHPNEVGHEYLARRIIGFLKTL